jgi:hypothetical protein
MKLSLAHGNPTVGLAMPLICIAVDLHKAMK